MPNDITHAKERWQKLRVQIIRTPRWLGFRPAPGVGRLRERVGMLEQRCHDLEQACTVLVKTCTTLVDSKIQALTNVEAILEECEEAPAAPRRKRKS